MISAHLVGDVPIVLSAAETQGVYVWLSEVDRGKKLCNGTVSFGAGPHGLHTRQLGRDRSMVGSCRSWLNPTPLAIQHSHTIGMTISSIVKAYKLLVLTATSLINIDRSFRAVLLPIRCRVPLRPLPHGSKPRRRPQHETFPRQQIL
jgi:hypothetical protein